MADVHNRTRYLQGCRCETCKLAQSVYTRERRQAKNRAAAAPAAPKAEQRGPTPPPAPADDNSVVAGVRKEIAGFVGAEDHPGLIATAVALAKILDTPSAIAQHAAAAGRLMDLMTALGKHGKKKSTVLGELRSLEGGKSA